jgi:IS30 family transposase
MELKCGRRGRPGPPPESREAFLAVLATGVAPAVAAAKVGVARSSADKWAREAGHRTVRAHFGTRYSPAVRAAFWEAMRSGSSERQAAGIAGVSQATARRWIRNDQFVPRTPAPTIHPDDATVAPAGPMTFVERSRLEALIENGSTAVEAASVLGRHRDTIRREMARGRTGSGYRAAVAQNVTEANARRPKPRKLENNARLRAEVIARLGLRHSPEQVSARLVDDFPDDHTMRVSHETIYQAMYVQPRGGLATEIKTALRTGRAKRKPQGRRSMESRGRIPDMVNIVERPAEAEDRAIPGHWEGDLIIGAHGASAVGTLVERTTGFVMLLHLPGDHTAATLAAAMSEKIPDIPEIMRRSLTWDQGSEMASHAAITAATGLPIYFCDPHSPWQRGTNENTNGLLRQYLPKGTDLSFHGPGILDNIAAELNGRPRKRHKWRTPAEEYERLISDPDNYAAATP